MIADLAELYPDVDWDAVRATPVANGDIEHLAETLIDAGCDPLAVKRFILDD